MGSRRFSSASRGDSFSTSMLICRQRMSISKSLFGLAFSLRRITGDLEAGCPRTNDMADIELLCFQSLAMWPYHYYNHLSSADPSYGL